MKKFIIKSLVVAIVIISIFAFTACDKDKVPDEKTLIAAGNSLQESLSDFKDLKTNYKYCQERHQTNGEDSFDYSLVKLKDDDIFLRNNYYNTNAGYQFRDESFTDYNNLTDKDYTVFKKFDSDYIKYAKFKNEYEEVFTKMYYENSESLDINYYASQYLHDYSFLNKDYFEYKEDNDEGTVIPYWAVKDEMLVDTTFKQNIINSMDLLILNDTANIYSFSLYVTNNKVSKIMFNYSTGTDLVKAYVYTIEFDYDNYNFDVNSLTTGFMKYTP